MFSHITNNNSPPHPLLRASSQSSTIPAVYVFVDFGPAAARKVCFVYGFARGHPTAHICARHITASVCTQTCICNIYVRALATVGSIYVCMEIIVRDETVNIYSYMYTPDRHHAHTYGEVCDANENSKRIAKPEIRRNEAMLYVLHTLYDMLIHLPGQ